VTWVPAACNKLSWRKKMTILAWNGGSLGVVHQRRTEVPKLGRPESRSRQPAQYVWIGLSKRWTGAVSGTSGHVGRSHLSPILPDYSPGLTSTNVNNNSARCCNRRRRRCTFNVSTLGVKATTRDLVVVAAVSGGAHTDVALASEWSAATPTVIRSTASPSVAPTAAAAAAQFSLIYTCILLGQRSRPYRLNYVIEFLSVM